MRYFLRLAYNGTPFHGWQSQPNAVSVQQTLEDAMSLVLRTPVSVTGAGRTDAGVHARMMWVHFDVENIVSDPGRLLASLNRLCGPDISLQELIPVENDAHARFDATSRTYKYFTTESKSPFLAKLAWQRTSSLDFEAMNKAGEMLKEVDDFTSFAKLHSDAKTNICKVTEAIWTPAEGGLWESGDMVFTITADRFLRNMVRAVVGTLVDVGRGKLTLDDFAEVIRKKDRCAAGTSMPAHALYLWEITYPFICRAV